MRFIPRSTVLAAPFIAVLTLAATSFARDPDLGEAASAVPAENELKPLDVATLGGNEGPVTDAASLTTGMAVSLAGALGVGPSKITEKPATGAWQEGPAVK